MALTIFSNVFNFYFFVWNRQYMHMVQKSVNTHWEVFPLHLTTVFPPLPASPINMFISFFVYHFKISLCGSK